MEALCLSVSVLGLCRVTTFLVPSLATELILLTYTPTLLAFLLLTVGICVEYYNTLSPALSCGDQFCQDILAI